MKGPSYIITTDIDGDEWPPTVGENVNYLLKLVLDSLVGNKYILGYELKEADDA